MSDDDHVRLAQTVTDMDMFYLGLDRTRCNWGHEQSGAVHVYFNLSPCQHIFRSVPILSFIAFYILSWHSLYYILELLMTIIHIYSQCYFTLSLFLVLLFGSKMTTTFKIHETSSKYA